MVNHHSLVAFRAFNLSSISGFLECTIFLMSFTYVNRGFVHLPVLGKYDSNSFCSWLIFYLFPTTANSSNLVCESNGVCFCMVLFYFFILIKFRNYELSYSPLLVSLLLFFVIFWQQRIDLLSIEVAGVNTHRLL